MSKANVQWIGKKINAYISEKLKQHNAKTIISFQQSSLTSKVNSVLKNA